jgi:hypothetical protein
MAAPNPPLPPPRNQPLPPNRFHPVNEAPFYDAYDYCLGNESETEARGDTTALADARCLGYLLCELPTKGQNVVANKILECVSQGSDMNELGKFYVDHLIRLCMLFITST